MKKLILLLSFLMLFPMWLESAAPTRTDTYVSQATIDPTAVTRNEDAIFGYLQTGVDVLANNSVTSAKIVDETIVSADIDDGTIVNADISSSAAIDSSKLTGVGDVTSAANITEHSVVRGADGAKGVELSTVFISDDGEMTNTSQPCFQVTKTVSQTSFAINTCVEITFNSEVFDVGNNFASNTFTAPVTGKYILLSKFALESVDTAAAFYYVQIATSNRNYNLYFSSSSLAQDATYWSSFLSIVADMDVNDTASTKVFQSGGAQQSDVSDYSEFAGALLN